MSKPRTKFGHVVVGYILNLLRGPKIRVSPRQWRSTYWGRIFSIPMTGGLWILCKIHPRIEQIIASKLAKNWYFKPIPMYDVLSEKAIEYKQEKSIEINKKMDIQTRILDVSTFNELLKNFPIIKIVDCGCRAIVKHCDNPLASCLRLNWSVDTSKDIPDLTKYKTVTRKEIEKVMELSDKFSLIKMALSNPDLDHIYTLCNCDDCCCVGFRLFREHATPNMVGSKFVARINTEKCQGCYHCINFRCRFRAIVKINEDGTIIDPRKEDIERHRLRNKEWSENRKGWGRQIRKDPPSWNKIKSEHSGKWFAKVDPNRCFGCGNCASPKYGCPEGAIKLYPRSYNT
jgi:ferredoxin